MAIVMRLKRPASSSVPADLCDGCRQGSWRPDASDEAAFERRCERDGSAPCTQRYVPIHGGALRLLRNAPSVPASTSPSSCLPRKACSRNRIWRIRPPRKLPCPSCRPWASWLPCCFASALLPSLPPESSISLPEKVVEIRLRAMVLDRFQSGRAGSPGSDSLTTVAMRHPASPLISA